MNISITRQSGISIKEQIRLEIAQRIRSGLLEEGRALPSVRQLAAHLKISLVTAHLVYKALKKDGLIESTHGKGTFVKYRQSTSNTNQPNIPRIITTAFDWQLAISDYLPRASFWSQSAVRLPPEILDLSTASIHHTLLPLDLLQTSIKQSLHQYPHSLGSYPPYQGDPEFLAAISHYLLNQGISLSPHQLIVTNGTQQGIDLFARTFLGPEDVIAMETPCFSSAIDAFRLSHATIQPIPIDQDGIRIDILEQLSMHVKIKAIYTVPTCQNPTGSIMSLKRRRELLNFAENNNILILEDDPHRELTLCHDTHIKKLPPTLKSLDTTGRVIYLKGFSKFLFPGLRLGVIAADGSIYNRLLAVKSITDLGSPLWLQKSLIPLFFNPQLTKYIKNLNQTLAYRSQLVTTKLAQELTPHIQFQKPLGGMHLWLTLPSAISTDHLIPIAHQQGIHFLPGSIFFPGEPELNHLRICWTNLSDHDLPKALNILCKILNHSVNSIID
ncbi:PLP-dependent aminotransferase family protein [Pelosinus sp. sgz500959]|uniref:aminotransferase-like domain-containing protein n=1 Tax=Pelosinus sp. sgz500959 TaxID=3242472 RepID=UPI00366FEFFC